jgi:hypothetical protein
MEFAPLATGRPWSEVQIGISLGLAETPCLGREKFHTPGQKKLPGTDPPE